FDVRGGGPQTLAMALSGGNQQKVVIAREVGRDPRVLVAAQPTRGLDVGAIEFVHRRLVEERDEGRAVLLVSLELEEILSLSGGNQQKVIVAREVERDPRVLVAAQPTRGLDVGAIEFVHRRLVAERDEGRAILLVSLELDEILGLSDRILVIYEGRIVGEFPPTASEEELGVAMTGGGRRAEAVA
ncbi:MAG TPA: hypothetical protein VIU16_07695, partial [Gaiellaceae bacterium]